MLDVRHMGEAREECRGGWWSAGDELMGHDAEMGELAEQGGAVGVAVRAECRSRWVIRVRGVGEDVDVNSEGAKGGAG